MRVFQYLSQWKSKAKDGIQQSLLVAKFLCLLHVTNNYICSPVMVYGPSMLPTLNLTGDVLLAEHLSPLLDKLGPGDVVLVRSPDNPRKTVTKRIVGMEGDTVTFLADPARSDRHVTLTVYGPSMLPTLNLTGDVLLAEHLSPLLDKLGPGDVVLVRSPDNPRKTVTKRIVGMEGDTVTFLADPARSDRHVTLTVPKGHVWIQGDNIYASKDSRQLGPIPYGLILGKVLCRVWPPEGFGSLRQ